jgi:arginyl-tRNA synthetase
MIIKLYYLRKKPVRCKVKKMLKETIEKYIFEAAGVAGDVTFQEMDMVKFGHYATNVALRLSKEQKKNPLEIAETLKEKILKKHSDFFSKIEVVRPGFLNLWIHESILHEELLVVLKLKEKYGASKTIKEKIQIEFISANPTGPLTLANGRGGFLGDAMANVLAFSGADVEREYYVNDTGRQVLTLGKSLIASQGHISDEETFYKGAYVKEWGDAHTDFILQNKENPEKVGSIAAKDFLGMIQDVIQKKSGIHFDKFTSEEKDIHEKKLTDKAFSVLQRAGFVYEKEGATWFKTTEFGDDKDRVLITSDGNPTYLLADAGHYLETKNRGFDRKINILGPDHYGYVARIQAAAKALGLKKSEVLITQAVRLMRKGEEVKMSKRKGEFIMFQDLIEEVGPDVARFFFLTVSPQTHMDFDLEAAKEHSTKNPVFYVQYAFVRAKSIVEKSGGFAKAPKKFIHLSTSEDIALLRRIGEFPEIVAETAQDLGVHRLTRYAIELARAFHNFYEHEHVQGKEKDVLEERLALVHATEITLSNLFHLLGISEPEKM